MENKKKDPSLFSPFKLVSSEHLTETTKLLRFKFPPGLKEFDLPVSSSVIIHTPFEKKPGKPLFRKYTPLDVDDKEHMDLIVKVYPGGRATTWLFDLKVGDEIKMYPHKNKHQYQKGKPLVMIAGGTGIAPMIQILKKIVSDPNDTTKVNLIFGGLDEKSLFYKSWLDEIAEQRKDQFTFKYCVESPSKSWKEYSGYIDVDLVLETLGNNKDATVLISGPPRMMETFVGVKKEVKSTKKLSGILAKHGYTKENVFTMW